MGSTHGLVKGAKFIQQTQKSQSARYEKKFHFERGRYIQCIPNPKNDNQRITVQIVERVLDEHVKRSATNMHKSMMQEMFGGGANGQDTQADVTDDRDVSSMQESAASQTYERYMLVSPEVAAGTKKEGEGEDDENDSLEESESLKSDRKNASLGAAERASKKSLFDTYGYGGKEARLYTDKSLFRDVDKLLGIQNQHYAEIEKSIANEMSVEARMKCKEFAVIAFWDLVDGDVL